MIICETCGCPNFHFCEEMGIVCENCIRTGNDCFAKVVAIESYPDWYDGSSKMDLITSDEVYE